MAGEEITKFAINSTLGTDKFKPLDKMIEEIYNNYHIVESTLHIGELNTEYKVKYNGNMYACLTLSKSSNQISAVYVIVTINGEEQEITFNTPSTSGTFSRNILFNVNKNDIIKVNFRDKYNFGVELSSGYIGGEIKPGDVPFNLTPLG